MKKFQKRLQKMGMLLSVIVFGNGLLWGCSSASAPAKTITGGQTTGGSGGTTQGPGGSVAGDTPLSPATVKSVLDAADTQFSSIVNGTTDHNMRNQQMAAWLQSRPEFAAAGITTADSVWGRMKDGHLYVATSTFIPGEEGKAAAIGGKALPTPAHPIPISNVPFRYVNSHNNGLNGHSRNAKITRDASNELPKQTQARVLLSLDKGFYNPPNDQIAQTLRDYHYNVIQQTATVDNLKSVSGDGAFYWGTHGTVALDDRTKTGFWAAWSATDVTAENAVIYKDDLNDGSLIYFTAAYQAVGNAVVCKTHYAITTKFIAKYNWSFADNCFLYMACCYSDFAQIVIDMGDRGTDAATFGWSNSVNVFPAWKAGAFAFDRLLGANRVAPLESTPQRPFDVAGIYAEMQDKHLDDGSVNNNGCLLIEHDYGPPLLAPTIHDMVMSERIQESPLRGKSKLTLNGQFGSDKGTVKIGGVEVPVDTWAKDKIECEPADLPGPGFAGDVLVLSHDRPSNSVPLTQWHGKLTYTIDLLPPQASNAVSTITCDVYFRGDVHKFRNQAGQNRNTPGAFNFRASQGSTSHWAVTGDPPPMAVWSGPLSADLPFGLNGAVNPPYGTGYIVSGAMDTGKGTVNFSFNFLNCVTAYAVPGGGTAVATIHDPQLTSQGSGIGSDGYVLYANNIPATITRDDFVIPGVTLTGSTPVFNPKLVITDFIPTYQPDDSKGEDNGH